MSLKVSRSIDASQCSKCSRNCSHRWGSAPAPRHDAVAEFMRYFIDTDNSVIDTVGFKVLTSGDPGYEEASRRARVLDVMIKVATDRHQLAKSQDVDKVLQTNRELLQAIRELYPRPPGVLDDLFDFGPEMRFRDRLPLIVRDLSVV